MYPIGVWTISWGIIFAGLAFNTWSAETGVIDYIYTIGGSRAQSILFPLVSNVL